MPEEQEEIKDIYFTVVIGMIDETHIAIINLLLEGLIIKIILVYPCIYLINSNYTIFWEQN